MIGFRFDLNAPHIVVPVRITGAQRVRWVNLILDTGSTSTVIDELVAFRLGYTLESAPTVSVTTVSGTSQASIIVARQIFALGMTVDEFPVLVMPLPAQLRADGLLGLDFLRRRNLFCNFEKGILLTLPFSRSFLHRLAISAQIFPAL
ncbi:retropepsin-like aspartic protease [Fervidibacter sacchari]|uniref:Aspartyl protease n=1 Tax=Candidatus Fervidibacter sacchari TaxID=1448929 RepID=A0ABT2EQH4_9BACT|nr:retropepsin-like aspartic protease [Candidatus Fervidibacter sacchari]MCS3919150.1 putative aspartyl protease [Candidatus Fervidibacter sacchari]WKU17118.1 retropepsin-like aspartic protease [Candidatus Fervidibacter sacchari]